MRLGWLPRYSIKHPKRVILFGILISLSAAPGLLRLKLRTDGHALVPSDAEEIKTDRSIRDEFGVEDPIVVMIRCDTPIGIYNPHTMRLVQDLTYSFEHMRGVRPFDVFSLATEHGDRVFPGTLRFRRFLEPLPTTREQLDTLRDDLRSIGLYIGTLVSRDEHATSIMVGVPQGTDRAEMYRRIREKIDQKGPLPERVEVIGAPVAEALLGTHILEDLGVPSTVLGRGTDRREQPIPWRLPRSLYEMKEMIAHNIGLVPIALAVMAIVFIASFRGVAAALLPLIEVAACLLFVFGLMGYSGIPVYLTVAVLPIILTAMGIADEIHIFHSYRNQMCGSPEMPRNQVVAMAMNEMWVPVIKTSVTTAIGFLSFAMSPITPVRVFGVFTAIGIIFCMIWSLTVIPASLVLMNPKWLLRRGAGGAVGLPNPQALRFARFGAWIVRHRGAVVILTLVVALLAPLGVRRIKVQDSWIDGFAPESNFYKATQYFNDQFLGMHILLVAVDAGHQVLSGTLPASAFSTHAIALPGSLVANPRSLIDQQIRLTLDEATLRSRKVSRKGMHPPVWTGRIEAAKREGNRLQAQCSRKHGLPRASLRLAGNDLVHFEITPQRMKTPDVLNEVRDLEEFIASRKSLAVGGVLGTADYLSTANFMSRARKEKERTIPDDPDRIEWVWDQYERIRSEARRRQVVDDHYARSLVTVFMKDANFIDTGVLMKEVRAYEESHLHPKGITLEFAGDVAVSQTLIGAIVRTQIISLLLSLVGITAVTALMGRSLAWGVLCVLPCALAVLFDFAAMGVVGMPLGVATSMFAGMTLGIGVDYAIHLLERYRRARSLGRPVEPALTEAVAATGPAILVDALAVALGFGILILSQVPANARLGGLVVLSIAGCLATTMLLLPALIATFARTPSSESAEATVQCVTADSEAEQ